MRTWRAVALGLVACHGAPPDEPRPQVAPPAVALAPAPPPPPRYGCAPDAPAAACTALAAALPGAAWTRTGAADGADRTLLPCPAGATPIGAWTYALVAPLYAPTPSIDPAALAALWRGEGPVALAATADTQRALTAALGPGRAQTLAPDARPTVEPARWAIVPADQLSPAWQVVAIAGHHPLEADADASPLTVPLCLSGAGAPPPPLRNVDRDHLTAIAMTGTTAMTRFMSALLDAKGVTYPARDVAPWFATADVVHVSNEVSFVPGCDQKAASLAFCSRESYIELLAAIHASVIELDGSHLDDYGREWIPHTLAMYAARGWGWFGGGRDQREGTRPLELAHHGNRVAFLGCNMPKTTAGVLREGPGVAACDLRRIARQVSDLRARGVLPIVAIQHEEVYVHAPPDSLVRDFRQLADAGAAVVFGSQAHCAHPWEVDHGAYVHYGAGNFFFDQEAPLTRDGVVDRLYVYEGRLLSVGHLFTRLEENGRPRPLRDAERAELLRALADALLALPPADPWAAPHPVARDALRPDAALIGGALQEMYVAAPASDDAPERRWPLVIALHGDALRGGPLERLRAHGAPAAALADPGPPHAILAAPHLAAGDRWTPARVAAIRAFLLANYPVDPAQVTVLRE